MIRSVNVKKEKRKTAERYENLHSTDPLATSSKIPAPSYLKIYTSSSDVSLLLPNCRWQMVWLSSSSSSSSKKTKAGFAGKYRWTDWRKTRRKCKIRLNEIHRGSLVPKMRRRPRHVAIGQKDEEQMLMDRKMKKILLIRKILLIQEDEQNILLMRKILIVQEGEQKILLIRKSSWYRKINKKSFWSSYRGQTNACKSNIVQRATSK